MGSFLLVYKQHYSVRRRSCLHRLKGSNIIFFMATEPNPTTRIRLPLYSSRTSFHVIPFEQSHGIIQNKI